MSIYRGLVTFSENKDTTLSVTGLLPEKGPTMHGKSMKKDEDEVINKLFEATQQNTSSILIYTILIGVTLVFSLRLLVSLAIWSLGL